MFALLALICTCPRNQRLDLFFWKGLTLCSKVLGSPNPQFWDPMILRITKIISIIISAKGKRLTHTKDEVVQFSPNRSCTIKFKGIQTWKKLWLSSFATTTCTAGMLVKYGEFCKITMMYTYVLDLQLYMIVCYDSELNINFNIIARTR